MFHQQLNSVKPIRYKHGDRINPGDSNNPWDRIIQLGELPTSHTSLQSVAQQICSTAGDLLDGDVSLYLSQTGFPTLDIDSSRLFELDTPTEFSRVMLAAIEKQKPILEIKSQDADAPLYTITAPIISGGRTFGAIHVERSSNKYSRSEKQIFKGLVAQAGITLATTRQRIIDRRSIELLELVRNVSQQITDIFDIAELSSRITQLILEKFHYYYVAIFTVDAERQTLIYQCSAGAHSPEVLEESLTRNISFGEGIIGQVGISCQELLVQNVDNSQHYRFIDGLPETESEFALPLIFNNTLLGVLDVQSNKENAFSDIDILVLKALADHIATALSNVGLYTDVNHRANQLSIVAEISKAISSILDFNHLLNYIVSLIHVRFNIPRVNLYTVHPGRNKMIFRAGAGQLASSIDLTPEEITIDLDPQQGLVPWAAIHNQSVTVNDTSNDTRYKISLASPETILSQFVIPLEYGDHVLGVLDLQSPYKYAFKTEDIFLFEMLADNISVAIRNANLYSSEQWRRQISESIKEVAGLISANIELENVLQRILQELNKSLPSDVTAIWLLDSYDTESMIEDKASSLKLAAIYPANDIFQELLAINEVPGTPCPWMHEALNSAMPLVRLPSSPYEPLGAYLNYPPDYSAIGAPLRANQQTLGLMVLIHKNPGKYGSESQAMTATFASYSAVAINNTRLYEAAHDQAWVATVLLQVAEATQSISSTSELLETVVQIIPRLIGLKSCALFLWDDITESFIPSNSEGFDDDQAIEFVSWHIAPGEVIAFDHLIEEKSPIILDSSSLPEEGDALSFDSLKLETELWGLFPMVAQNNVRGAIMINFTSAESHAISSQERFEEKYIIIQGIANQTAVALENIMLLQSQEEEAYTSVALLQVAQAIVSLNNIEEILGTIVRITPILAGVKRCAIYLVDSEEQAFLLSQAYGISKQELLELPKKYMVWEHTWLQAICSPGSHTVRLLPEGDESPILWDKYSNSDFMVVPQHDDLESEPSAPPIFENYFKYKGRIQYGFPLSIKGNMLGAMIFEEGSNPRGTPSTHIRQRRFEIITGITQQAALAIHNELLQREAVIRERLEREMQLAREIQTTFLPEVIQPIRGWDLDIHWRPARQVGGDFFDLFEFPDGKIGLIMADVADKGMPAALFMVLTRTLIRAAAKDNTSPAEILKQVNDLLVPDAKHGMFVTVLIAVISPTDGSITYANAGHNPPIVQRSDRTHQELMPTGMALGILEQITIKEDIITVNPGDKVVFYTDGITEAFSMQDEMFGVERLRSVIESSQDQFANGLLSTIEDALSNFLGGAPQSDDLTIAALIRK